MNTEISEGTDKERKATVAVHSQNKGANVLLVASIILGVAIPVRGIATPESERTLLSNRRIFRDFRIL